MNEEGPNESKLVGAAEQQIERLTRPTRRLVRLLSGLCALILAMTIVLTVVVFKGHHLVETVQHGAIASCESGNKARATNVKIWDEFLNILVTNPNTSKTRLELESEIAALGLPADVQAGLDDIVVASWSANPGDIQIVGQFKAYIKIHEKQQHCHVIYGS